MFNYMFNEFLHLFQSNILTECSLNLLHNIFVKMILYILMNVAYTLCK